MATRRRRAKRRTRRNPAPARRRTGTYYPKAGQRRLSRPSRRRAYANPRRRARRRRSPRRNQRGIVQTPAFQYGLAAVGGAAAAAVLNAYADDAKAKAAAAGTEPGFWALLSPKIGEYELHPGVIGALVALGLASTKMIKQAKTRQMVIAFGAGMLAPVAVDAANQYLGPKDNPRHYARFKRSGYRGALPSPRTSSYVSANAFARDLIPSN